MRVVRPKSILGTPKLIAQKLGARLRYWPNPRRPKRIFDFRKDFLYTLPFPDKVRNYPIGYAEAQLFYALNKFEQRQALAQAGIPVPATAGTHAKAMTLAGGKFVVRRLRHQKGQLYRTTDDPRGFIEGQEYISEVFPKTREYRIIFVFGKPLIQLRKIPPDGAAPEGAWNHAQGSKFRTVNQEDVGVLKTKTNIYDALANFSPIKNSHICAVDVLFNSKLNPNYVVCEINSCPSLTIEKGLDKVIEAIRSR